MFIPFLTYVNNPLSYFFIRYGEQAWEQIQELIEHQILEAEEEMPQTISPSQARDIAALLTHRLDVQDENIFNADLFKRDVKDG